MHTYLRSIGFSEPINRGDIFRIIEEGVKRPKFRDYVLENTDSDFLFSQFDIELGEGFGLSVFGTFDSKDKFYPDYYFPYFEAGSVSSMEQVSVEKRIDNDSYTGICDDLRLGVTMIFRLLNAVEYRKNVLKSNNNSIFTNTSLSLSALSVEGKVILPIEKSTEEQLLGKEQSIQKRKLMELAKNGDEESTKRLSLLDMENSTKAFIHFGNGEDLYSIVDNTFMPYGVECELYSVLGDIKRVSHSFNRITNDDICRMTIDINGLEFDMGINTKDLVGNPSPGMRFKGNIWLLGKINFPEDIVDDSDDDETYSE